MGLWSFTATFACLLVLCSTHPDHIREQRGFFDDLINNGQGFVNQVVDHGQNIVDQVKNQTHGAITSVINNGQNVVGNLTEIGHGVIKGITDHAEQKIEVLQEEIKNLIEAIKNQKVCKFHSIREFSCCATTPLKNEVCFAVVLNPADFSATVSLSFNQREVVSRSFSARNPDPICGPIPALPIVSFCLLPYDLTFDNGFHICLQLEAKVLKKTVATASLDCMRVKNSALTFEAPTVEASKGFVHLDVSKIAPLVKPNQPYNLTGLHPNVFFPNALQGVKDGIPDFTNLFKPSMYG